MAFNIEIAAGTIAPHTDAVVRWQLLPGVGATVTFTGQVRRDSQAGDVSAIDLEHYPGMSERLLLQLLQDAAARWGIVDESDNRLAVGWAKGHPHAG